MARKRRSYRGGGGKRKRSRRSRGMFGGIKLYDVSQGVLNADGLGYIDAGQQAMSGNFLAAAYVIRDRATNPATMVGLAFDNLFLGFGRKIVRATGGKFVRRYIA